MSNRAEFLAERLERGVRALASFARALTDSEWEARLPHDGRTVGTIVHHVASFYPMEIEMARALAAGHAVKGVTPDDVSAMYDIHARAHHGVTRAATLKLLRRNAAAAVAAIRALSDGELDRAAPVSLYCDAPLTCQFVLEDQVVRHSYHHLALLRRAVAR